MERKKATPIGLIAIVLWSTMVGLIRGVSEGLGPVGGAAAFSSLSGRRLSFPVGFRRIWQIPKGNLLAGSWYFGAYETGRRFPLGFRGTVHRRL
ncbi:EamA family transporter, partial [Escherichia coli]|nr:EamA family transporter [Escherichia coli]